MKTYCLKCEKKFKKNNRKFRSKSIKNKHWQNNVVIKMCCIKKNQDFQKEQEAKGIVSSLGLKIPLKVIYQVIF